MLRQKQNWSIGETVKVGFLTLKVTGYSNQGYLLESSKGVKYEFIPYQGLCKVS